MNEPNICLVPSRVLADFGSSTRLTERKEFPRSLAPMFHCANYSSASSFCFFPTHLRRLGTRHQTLPVETLTAVPMARNVARAKIVFPTDLVLFIYSPTHGFVGVIRDNTVQVPAQFTISILFKALIYYTGLVSSIAESFATSRETKHAVNAH